jgi:hypothetical protein
MLFILVVAVFFYSSTEHPPEAISATFDTPTACLAARDAAVLRANASPKVQSVEAVCIRADRGQKS